VVGTHAPIRAALQAGGYGPADHEEGLRLLVAACPYGTTGLDPADDAPARQAVAELDHWTKGHLPRLRAALEHLHPEALGMLAELECTEPAGAVLSVATLLKRLDALESEQGSSSVLDTLARRGVDLRERQRLLTLVQTAQHARGTPRGPSNSPTLTDEPLLALHHWFADWSSTARTFVTRRDWLIRLGLSRRRRRGET
jgi:hypothetical protein